MTYTINQRLKQLRAENNLTQTNLADILGIAKTTLAAYEQGKSEPSNETILKIANHFNVSTDFLLGNSNYKNPQEEFDFKNAIVLSEENELLTLFKRITSCYQFLNNLYTDNNIRPVTSPLFHQLIQHLYCVVSAYEFINDCPPESTEEIGEAIGSFILFINMNFDSMKFGKELAHLYQNIKEPPTTE